MIQTRLEVILRLSVPGIDENLWMCLGDSTVGDVPTKADGTADMRFTASKDAVESGGISADQVLDGSGASGSDAVSSGQSFADSCTL